MKTLFNTTADKEDAMRTLLRPACYIVMLLVLSSLSACAPTAEGPFRDYYVATMGSNSSGNGSESRPWQTIQHALDSADYSGRPVHIYVAEGEYPENLNITTSVLITGAGSGNPLFDSGLSVVIGDFTDVEGRDPIHAISGEIHIEIRELTFQYGRVGMTGGSIVVEDVWFNSIRGLFGLQLTDVGAFSVINSEFHTGTRIYADLGIDVTNSTGEIIGGYFGDWLDHPIDLGKRPDSRPMIVTIDGVTISGSPIFYADGIRVFGDPIVTIQNSTIRRTHSDNELWTNYVDPGEIVSDGIAAGIGFQSQVNTVGSLATQTLRNNTISGFDVGLAFDIRNARVLAEGNDISAVRYGVNAWRWPSATASRIAILDFGNGRLGSAGGNTFQNEGEYAFYLNEEYDVSACYNDWTVPDTQIDPDRIYDQVDDATRGRVFWLCLSFPIEAGPTEGLVQILIETPTPQVDAEVLITDNARCRTGPGFAYVDYDFFSTGDTTTLLGRNASSDWFLVQSKNYEGQCWIGQGVLDLTVVTDVLLTLPELTPPPTPIPTATLTPTPDPDEGSNNQPLPSYNQGGASSAPAEPGNAYIANQTCTSQEYKVKMAWFDAADNEDGYRIYRDGQLIATLGANAQEYADNPPYGGPYTYTIEAFNGAGTNSTTVQDVGCIA